MRIRTILLGLLLGTGVYALPAHASPVICGEYATESIQGGKYNVQNNRWGASTTQCIDVNQNGGFRITQADHNKPTNGAPASYPSIYAGCHYGLCTSGSGLPVQANSGGFGNLRSSVSMSYSSGTWDAAYDIWFDPTPRRDGQNTGAEVMIWLNKQGSIQPVGSKVATVSLVGGTWDVWFGNTGWNVISYVRISATSSLDFSINTFYSDVVNRGYGSRSWYMTSVQAGFEPWIGGTGLAVNSFNFTTSGNPDPDPNPNPAGGCKITPAVQSQWSSGYVLAPTVTNSGSGTTNAWKATITLPAGHTLAGGWGGTATASGQTVTIVNAPYNGTLTAGASTSFGVQVNRPDDNRMPSTYACTTS